MIIFERKICVITGTKMREKFVSWSGSVSQWPKWLRCQYGKLEICGSSPGYDTNFSLQKLSKKFDHLFVYLKIGSLSIPSTHVCHMDGSRLEII